MGRMIEVYVVLKDGTQQYYLLKVIQRDFDIYCIPPHLGMHYSLHGSGKAHFRFEQKSKSSLDALPVALVAGEAGKVVGEDIALAPLPEIGRASCICTALYPINSLSNDFQKFKKSAGECFVIDAHLFPQNTSFVKIGVWAVPDRNKASFEFNNPNIPEYLLYKVARCEPQIWIYAQPR